MSRQLQWLSRLTLLTALLAWLVIGLGAYTRLSDAGLGCPDWPGCYGHWVAPSTSAPVLTANKSFPQTPVVVAKAWAEMIHRYAAALLGLLIIANASLAALLANRYGFSFLLFAMLLFALLIYQAVLGMWTVTLKLLPVVVTQHLIGGMALLALLWLLHLKTRQALHFLVTKKPASLSGFALLGLVLLAIQILLGAWTSTNYAGISCSHFPFCQNYSWHFNFYQAFTLLSPVSTLAAKMTIHVLHRWMALWVMLYLLGLSAWILLKMKSFPQLQKLAYATLFVLSVQIGLGIANVIFALPLGIAVAHNLCAGLLLICVVTINFITFTKPMITMPLVKEIYS